MPDNEETSSLEKQLVGALVNLHGHGLTQARLIARNLLSDNDYVHSEAMKSLKPEELDTLLSVFGIDPVEAETKAEAFFERLLDRKGGPA
jgi:hypothetical protein